MVQCYEGSYCIYKYIMLPGVKLYCHLTEDKLTIGDVTDTIVAETFGLHEIDLRHRSARNVSALYGQYRICFCIGLLTKELHMVSKITLYYGVCCYKSGHHDGGCCCSYVTPDISIGASLFEVILRPSALLYLQN